jgi:nucleotide-binding universal stress UspA family protein
MSTPENQSHGCVVVGLDEHGHPATTLLAAAGEADRRGVELAVVTVLHPNLDPGLNLFGRQRDHHLAEATALQGLHEAATSVRSSHPRLSVVTYCLRENEVAANREPLLGAELLVVGTQDRYARQALVLGSISWLLLTSGRCPVLVVPDRRQHRGSEDPAVLVGVSEHPADAAVVKAGYAAAADRGGEVLLVHAYTLRGGESPEQGRDRARTLLAGYITQAPPGIRASMVVTEEEPATALLRLATQAQLLVIGGRTGALSGLVRGSVSHALLETVPCPLLAMPRHLVWGRPGPLTGLVLDSPEDRAASPPST